MGWRNLILAAVVVVALAMPETGFANIYAYKDDSGVYHFTNIAPANRNSRVILHTGKDRRSLRGSASAKTVIGGDKSELISLAKTYLGSPYKLGGNQATTGIDCSGFVKQVFSAFDVKLPRTAKEQFNEGTKVEKDDLVTGDLVFFRHPKTNELSHVGIFIDDDKFIHASTRNGGGVRIDSLTDNFYRRTYLGANRLIQ